MRRMGGRAELEQDGKESKEKSERKRPGKTWRSEEYRQAKELRERWNSGEKEGKEKVTGRGRVRRFVIKSLR